MINSMNVQYNIRTQVVFLHKFAFEFFLCATLLNENP